jgi:hypothetical protein
MMKIGRQEIDRTRRLGMMGERKMIDADGHIREIESDVFEYFPEHYKKRLEAVLYFPLLPRPSKLIERGQIYFHCGEEMTTGRDLDRRHG